MKKTIIPFYILFALSATATAQEADKHPGRTLSKFSLGVRAGVNITNVKVSNSPVFTSPHPIPLFTGGVYAIYDVSKTFAIQLEITYNRAGFKSNIDSGLESKALLSYLAAPLLAKYKFAHTGFALYAGPQIAFLLSAKGELTGFSNIDLKSLIRNTDMGGTLGAEYNFGIGLNISVRYVLGFLNIEKNPVNGESLKTRTIGITIGYKIK